jgi:F0F1-type ATP synthase assembly protein I
MNSDNPQRESRGWSRAVRDSAPYMGVGLGAAATILLGLGAGYWADGKFGTRPILLLVGGMLGLAAAGYHFVRTMGRLR